MPGAVRGGSRPGGLRGRLAVALLGLALLSTALLGAVAVYRLNWELAEQLTRRGEALARHLADEVFFRAYVQGEPDLVTLAESALGDDVEFVEIVREGEALARAGALPPGPRLEVWQAVLDSSVRVVRREPAVAAGTEGSATAPPAGMPPSYVRLALSLDYLAYERRQEMLWIGGAGVGVALASLAAAWILSGLTLRPLAAVTESLRRFGNGELAVRAPAGPPGELGELARSFNQMADAIVRMQRELEAASRTKSEFLTFMGHELRTPLGVVLGSLELVLEGVAGEVTEGQRRYLQAAVRSGEHLQALLANVLNFAKLEMGVERLHVEEADLLALARETVEALEPLAREHGATVRLEVAPAPALVDRTKVRQILFNLVQNAIQHSPPGGEVVVSAGLAPDGGVLLAVQDQGPGVAPEDRERLFEPFVRLDRHPREGLGLGLAIVRRYAELHGGRAWVESEPGRGSTFRVSLPPPARRRRAG